MVFITINYIHADARCVPLQNTFAIKFCSIRKDTAKIFTSDRLYTNPEQVKTGDRAAFASSSLDMGVV